MTLFSVLRSLLQVSLWFTDVVWGAAADDIGERSAKGTTLSGDTWLGCTSRPPSDQAMCCSPSGVV